MYNNATPFTPEQRILFDLAVQKLVGTQTITSLFFEGVVAGSEFLTYSNKKIYIGLSCCFGCDPTLNAAVPAIYFKDESNTTNLIVSKNAITGVNYSTNYCDIINVYFAALAAFAYTYIKFIGYKITIP